MKRPWRKLSQLEIVEKLLWCVLIVQKTQLVPYYWRARNYEKQADTLLALSQALRYKAKQVDSVFARSKR